jgi:hypothetical protein
LQASRAGPVAGAGPVAAVDGAAMALAPHTLAKTASRVVKDVLSLHGASIAGWK